MSSTPPPPAPAEPTLQERIQQLKAMFPALFGGAPKPLKLRIQADIQERAPGVFTKQVLSAFLRRHTGSHAYLVAITRGTHRFDLDGAPSGEISEEHRQAAAEELARRRGNTEARRALEDEQRRNRAGLLHDFERTTLTAANFCALKGIAPEELDGLLAIARAEAQQAQVRPDARHPQGGDRQRFDGPQRGRGPGDRGPGDRGPGRHGPQGRGPDGRGPRAGGPAGRGPGPAGDRGPDGRGPGDRAPERRAPDGRGPRQPEFADRGPAPGPRGPGGGRGRRNGP
jgi:hypothetical protein